MSFRRAFDPLTARDVPPVASRPDRACNGVDFTVFYPKHSTRYEYAKAICRTCPHVEECLAWALSTRQSFGVWGGTSPEDRHQMLRQVAA